MEKRQFAAGFRDGIPIGLGYFTVALSVGIACHNAGLDALQGFLISLLNNASAGEYAGLTVLAADAGFAEMVLMMLVVNARYLLMGCALSQRLPQEMPTWQRVVMGYDLTDEVFGLAISQPGKTRFDHYFGAMCAAVPSWSLGTVAGILLGTRLSPRLISAFSVTLFGMFLAVIIPAAKKDRVVLGCVGIGFAASYAAQSLPGLSALSSGSQTILLTLLIAGAAAWLFPHEEEADE